MSTGSATGPTSSHSPPTTRTFLFTDIEGSTRLLQSLGDEYHTVLATHNVALSEVVAEQGGEVFGSAGDGRFCVFPSALSAVRAAAEAQRQLSTHARLGEHDVRVRMAVHTGEAVDEGGDYGGLVLHEVSRILSAAWGGQVLVSHATRELVGDAASLSLGFRDLGEHRLKDLARPVHLHQLVIDGLPSDFPPPRSLDGARVVLPAQVTSFIGRETEIATVKALLETSRLVTLTGPGGTGKTRLSLRIAEEVADRFRDGVRFVELAAVTEPDLVASATLQVLGLQEAGKRPPAERLLEHLVDEEMLLVLDNFEQVMEAASLVADILRAAPHVRLLVTSRAALHVYGEQEFPVPPLDLPDPRGPAEPGALVGVGAVALFIDRARAVRPDFHLDAANAEAVARIVSRLDGLPLALELAAARVKLLPPQAIVDRLDRRLHLLSTGSRDLPTRQQTLRDAIAWSYDLLDDAARRLFARLSVFVGSFRLEEAEVVCGPADELGADVLDGIGLLVDQSLLHQDEGGGRVRFRMLETIREFAAEQLTASGDADVIERRHTDVYLALVEEAEPHLLGPAQQAWLDRLDAEHEDIRAVLTRAVRRGDVEAALRVLGAVWRFWQMRGHLYEARRRAERVLAMEAVGSSPDALARAYEAAGGIAYWQGDMPAAGRWYRRSLEWYRRVGDPARVANALYNYSFPHAFGLVTGEGERSDADTAKALELQEEALTIYRGLGDDPGIAKVLWGMADTHMWRGEYDAARRSLLESLDIFRRIDEPFGLGWALFMLGGLEHMADGDIAAARSYYGEALEIFHPVGDLSAEVLVLDGLAQQASAEGDEERAVIISAAAARLRDETGTDLLTAEQAQRPDWVAPGEGLAPEVRTELEERGRAMDLDEVVRYVRGPDLADPGASPL
jgi:predicted ATPase/class 3 adenylate cyclase